MFSCVSCIAVDSLTTEPLGKLGIVWSHLELEPIIQSEVSQKDKDQYSIPTHVYMKFRKMVTITLYGISNLG